ncbi:MAG: carbamoyltransferase HypF [Methanobrevibacter sp.]|nr:carbamoyltransferase HypF [Methanobrevibacter sp.]
METKQILVEGIVQGVGFRPFVYRIATEASLNGYVRNLGNVVEIIVQGSHQNMEEFLFNLQNKLPPIAKINNIETRDLKEEDEKFSSYTDFTIKESADDFAGTSVIPPDVAICDNCLEEINDPQNRRYKYPFNACTDCGPRFTVIEKVPYDRDNTTMEDFPLCDECEIEYTNPLDRRYHAEAACCEDCGPSLKLLKNTCNDGEDSGSAIEIDCEDPLKETARLLDEGKILAIKGIGGTHLVANVKIKETVDLLRQRLGRKSQAFAVMSPDIETIKTFAIMSKEEEKTLKSKERPIVILKKSEGYDFADSVSPDLHNIGVMLPYAPLHHLLFNETDTPAYIMTSANVPGEPMMITNEEIVKNLSKIADYYLVHNRRILNRCDDSVVRFRNDELAFIRRSRGYTPEPYDLSGKYTYLNEEFDNLNILALGPELDVTFTIIKNSKAYVSQHIGNTNKYRTYQFLKEAIEHMMQITKTDSFDLIACDMHPQFFTTQLAKEYAEKYDCPLIQVQHHHAHGVSLINDHVLNKTDLDEKTSAEIEISQDSEKAELLENPREMIIIASDGVGYGDDGGAWGGEILYTDIKSYKRMASLMPQKMPGGDLCTKYPVRMLAAILSNPNSDYERDKYGEENVQELMEKNYLDAFPHGKMEIASLFKQIERNLNVGINTSTGRCLDSIAAALNICHERSYEGEAPMKLESAAFNYLKMNDSDKLNDYPIIIKDHDDRRVLDTTAILRYVIDKLEEGENIGRIAAAGQETVSIGLAKLAIEAARDCGIDTVGVTGGTFYNEAITAHIKDCIENAGLKFIQHTNSCPGDGSVSLGQAIVAGINFKK